MFPAKVSIAAFHIRFHLGSALGRSDGESKILPDAASAHDSHAKVSPAVSAHPRNCRRRIGIFGGIALFSYSTAGLGCARYDADGNVTADGGVYTYTYNAENQITSAGGVNYTYDGDGLRVEKSGGTLYWRSYTGQVIEETDASGNMTTDYIYFGGRQIAWRDSGGHVFYVFADALGSTRAVTTGSGTGQTPGQLCWDADYYPYGQENDYTSTLQTTACPPTYKFTGYEYDSETGNYYAYARYYDPRIGRFLSADPLGGSIANPQSLNRYSYVVNNPESLVDPLGLDYKVCSDFGGLGAGEGGGEMDGCWVFRGDFNGLQMWATGYRDLFVSGTSEGGTLYWLVTAGSYWASHGVPPGWYLAGEYDWIPGTPGGPPHAPAAPVRDGGGTGAGQAPQTQTPQTQTPKQKYQQCMSSFTSSTAGKAVSLFSALNIVSNWEEWVGGLGAKLAGLGALKAEASATVTDYSIMQGTATTATTGLETVLDVGSKVLGSVGTVATGGATLLDANQRLACAGVVSPEGEAALAGPILFPFP